MMWVGGISVLKSKLRRDSIASRAALLEFLRSAFSNMLQANSTDNSTFKNRLIFIVLNYQAQRMLSMSVESPR